jgi:hypothetical protein
MHAGVVISSSRRVIKYHASAELGMSDDKRTAIELIERLPDDVDTEDIIEELYFKIQVDRGLQDVREGRTVSHAQLKERIAAWRKSDGR